MALREADLIVVVDASTVVSSALKADSLPERALLQGVDERNRLYGQHEFDAQIHVPQQVRREPTDPLRQQLLVHRDQLRHVDDRIPAQAAGTCADPNVAGRPLEAEVGTYDRTDDRANRAFIEVIGLNNEQRSPKSWP